MKPIDLKELVNGLIAVILIALAVGKYGELREFAKKEFVRGIGKPVNKFYKLH